MIRLQKHIADLGITSRRKAETLIVNGGIKVNGLIVKTLGIKIDPEKDKVEVIQTPPTDQGKSQMYVLLNKPIDYTTDTNSPPNKNILSLLVEQNHVSRNKKTIKTKLTPISQLDENCEGLVILTNDEKFLNLSSEQYDSYEKEYEITIDHPLSRDAKKVLGKGLVLDNEEFQGLGIKKEFNKGRITIVTVVLQQEKPQQIRKMFERLGYSILSIKRTKINTLTLGTLSPGQWLLIKKDKL